MKTHVATRQFSSRIAGLDTLRALAIVGVMAFHLNWRLPEGFAIAGKFGWIGVDLFFVLSGYLIGAQVLRPMEQGRGVDVLGFYRNRAYRILPTYFAVLLLYTVWPRWHEADGMSPVWEFLTFTENLFVEYGKNQAFSHVWSLCVEEHFYLLLPIAVMVLARRPAVGKTVTVLGALMLLGVAVRWYELVHVLRPLAGYWDAFDVKYIERIYYPTYSRLDGLLCGVELAVVKVFRPRWWTAMQRRSNWLLGVGLLLACGAVWMFWERFSSVTGAAAASTVIGFPVLSIGMALWIPAAADAGCWLGRWRLPGARWVAMLAFSLYLTHKEVASVMASWLPGMAEARDWRTVPVYGVSCVLVAAALYFAVERPFLMLRDRKSGRAADKEARMDPAL